MFNKESLEKYDAPLWEALMAEQNRQEDNIELIASENYTSPQIMLLQGSILTNKYAEGYPGRRYYGGCEFVDKVEQIAIERANYLFQSKYANVQPHSGSQANAAAYMAFLELHDKILAMSLSAGGHLTHGSPVNFSGKAYQFISYGVDAKTGLIDYQQVADLAKQHRPKLILAGFSAYSRIIDWKIFREIADDVGAYFMVDMAHVAGLVAAGLYPNPVPSAHVVTSTTHKTLRGPRGGFILSTDENSFSKKINSAVFPGLQGGPLMHVIAAKALAFKEAATDSFKQYQKQILRNAKIMASVFMEEDFHVISQGTDNHLFLVDLQKFSITGKEAEKLLDTLNITVNKNSVPNDPASPMITSGIRIGSPAITTRGFKENESKILAQWICFALKNKNQPSELKKIKSQVLEICRQYPVYQDMLIK